MTFQSFLSQAGAAVRALSLGLFVSGVGAMVAAPPTVVADPLPHGLSLEFDIPDGPADIVIDFVGTAAGDGKLAATTDSGIRLRVEGRRIVVPGVAAGRTTVVVTGDVGGFAALVIQGGVVTPVTVRSP